MQEGHPWRTALLIAAALIAGTFLGPPVVQAATASLVTIQGSGSTSQVKVTKAGQLEETPIDPASAVTVLGTPACTASGFYTIPAGKALIITGVSFSNSAAVENERVEFTLTAGPTSTPCMDTLASGVDSDVTLTLSQDFQPGIPVPAGDCLGMTQINNNGTAEIYGYLVPKAEVPATILQDTRTPAGHTPRIKLGH
jgi:hypothetical protein